VEISARTALLLALQAGPGFGLELIERVRERTRGGVRLNRGGVYLRLRALEERGLVRGWKGTRRGVGRPRRYYELTPSGIRELEKARATLRGLIEPEGLASTEEEARRMTERVRRAAELSRLALRLRELGRRAGLPR
jgi:PadR family transcriptional regulator PadR